MRAHLAMVTHTHIHPRTYFPVVPLLPTRKDTVLLCHSRYAHLPLLLPLYIHSRTLWHIAIVSDRLLSVSLSFSKKMLVFFWEVCLFLGSHIVHYSTTLVVGAVFGSIKVFFFSIMRNLLIDLGQDPVGRSVRILHGPGRPLVSF